MPFGRHVVLLLFSIFPFLYLILLPFKETVKQILYYGQAFFLKNSIFNHTCPIPLNKFLQLAFKIHHMRKSTRIYFRKYNFFKKFNDCFKSLI